MDSCGVLGLLVHARGGGNMLGIQHSTVAVEGLMDKDITHGLRDLGGELASEPQPVGGLKGG